MRIKKHLMNILKKLKESLKKKKKKKIDILKIYIMIMNKKQKILKMIIMTKKQDLQKNLMI